MRRLYLICSFLLMTLVSFGEPSEQPDDIKLISSRIVDWFLKEYYVKSDETTKEYFEKLNDDGFFSDIDYDSHEASAWAPIFHLERLMQLAGAYIDSESVYYQSDNTYERIVKALNFYLTRAPWSTNWYKGQIWEPRDFGLICLLMNEGKRNLPDSTKQAIINKWDTCGADPINFSAANRTEVATHYVYFACIKEDTELLNTSLEYIYEPIKYSADGEGIQIDNSYFDNGPQLYIGGYGIVMLDVVLRFGGFCYGTKFEINKEKIGILRNYIFQTVADAHRGKYLNYNCIGRSIARKDYLSYNMLIRALEKMKIMETDSCWYPEYDHIIVYDSC